APRRSSSTVATFRAPCRSPRSRRSSTTSCGARRIPRTPPRIERRASHVVHRGHRLGSAAPEEGAMRDFRAAMTQSGHRCAFVLASLLVLPLRAGADPVVVDRFDTNHSTVGFSVPILDGLSEVEGKFVDFKVVLHYDPAHPTQSSVEATIAVASIDT